MTGEERKEREEREEDRVEDLDLSDEAAGAVRGGQDVTVNKAKTADKAFKAMDQYIRG
jgi:hypothetical protein